MRQILLFAALATSLALLSGCTLSKTKADTAEDMTGKVAYHKISAEEAYERRRPRRRSWWWMSAPVRNTTADTSRTPSLSPT